MDSDLKENVLNGWEIANPFSKLSFSWVFPILMKGFSKDLTIHDLPDCPSIHKAQYQEAKLQKAWQCQLLTAKQTGQSPKLWKALFSLHYKAFLFTFLLFCVDELFLRIVQPIFLIKLVKSFNKLEHTEKSKQIFFAVVVCLSALGHNLVYHHGLYLMFRTGLSCCTSMSSMLYRKALRLRTEESSVTGPLFNLLSNDLCRFQNELFLIPYIVIGPLQFVIFTYLLYQEMGVAAFCGGVFFVFVLPYQLINGRLSAKFRLSVAQKTDKRSKIMNQIILAIKTIKMYTWEKPFSNIISRIRKNEVTELRKRAYLKAFSVSLFTISTRLCAFLIILTYVLQGNTINADKAFFCVAICYIMMESIMYSFSFAVSGLGECLVSTRRVQEFMLLPEQWDSRTEVVQDETKISVKNVTTAWKHAESEKTTLKNVNLSMKGDQLVMIVGQVGSGKTSLLNAFISEIPTVEGQVFVSGKISYASQEAWIFPASLRQNILFGEEFEASRYSQVVTACALVEDFQQLPYGDMSILGEKGITLSGGQKARVNLARCVYRKAEIYLLDDVLSAVDSKVGRQIFEKCIQTYLKGNLRILVTHQLQYLPQADHVVVLDNGKIQSQGTYEDLIESGVDFMTITTNKLSKVQPVLTNKTNISEAFDSIEFDKPDGNFEKMEDGAVTLETYWQYIKSASSCARLFLVTLLFIVGQVLLTSSEYWLAYWTDSEELHTIMATNHTEVTLKDTVPYYLDQSTFIIVYSSLIGLFFIFTISKATTFFSYCLRISDNLHNKMFQAIVRAPTKFFDKNPSGRIMNRFTKDIGSIDEFLPPILYDTLEFGLEIVGIVGVVIYSNNFLIVPSFIIVFGFWVLRIIFLRTSRDIRRLEAVWKSPVFTHVAASLQGLSTIRVLGAQNILVKQFDDKQDIHTSTWFALISATRCFAVYAEVTGILFLAIIISSFLILAEETSAGIVRLVISSTLTLTVNMQWVMRQSAELENHMISVERALDYANLKPEAPLECPKKKPAKDWPAGGAIKFQNVFLNYDDGKDVLHNLSFEIHAKEKIGIVGRTGAGKSSIISALFRLAEPRGSIFIDNVSITEIGLHDLRQVISIIPQDPILFSETMRYNLDPFGEFSDARLWKALEQVQLKDDVPALDFQVLEGGRNFSVGQKQLVCLARAILHENKIIVMDAATANVDLKTDAFIQKTIRQKFANCTIITIAHRLDTVLDCDRILVLDSGKVVELDHPDILLQKEDGFLTKLAQESSYHKF